MSWEEYEEDELEQREWIVPSAHSGTRIDKLITEWMGEEVSRSQIQQWIKDEFVTVNDQPTKANYKVAEHDHIRLVIPPMEPMQVKPEPIPLDIVYEDDDLLVVNKLRGMVVHPAHGHPSGTLVNALLYHSQQLSDRNGNMRPGIVHRLDKDTSGLLVVAKTDRAHESLVSQFRAQSVTRKYVAIVHGVLAHPYGTIDAPIGRDPHDRKKFAVTETNSKPAVTHFSVIEHFDAYTYLQVKLETGRTHQIRVHMKFIGHPVVGDPLYGRSKGITMQGQALHATILGFQHPVTGKYMEFEAPLPEDMNDLLNHLRKL